MSGETQRERINNEWWKKVEEIYHTARELNGEARSPFLDTACKADAAMRRQIEVLLQQDEGRPCKAARNSRRNILSNMRERRLGKSVPKATTMSRLSRACRLLSAVGGERVGRLVAGSAPPRNRRTWVLPLQGEQKPRPLIQSPANQWDAHLSPDN